MNYFERVIKPVEEKPSHWQTLCKTSTGSSALNSATLRYPMSSSEIRVPMPASRQLVHRLQSIAKLLIWINLDEWRNHNGETKWRGPHKKKKNINCGSRQDHPQHNLKWWRTLTYSPKHWWENSQNSEDIVAELIRGKLKFMTEATCSEWLIGGTRNCASGQHPYDERHLMLPWLLLWRGRIFHPHCDGWRIVPVDAIRDQMEEDPREASSSNGRRYDFRQYF